MDPLSDLLSNWFEIKNLAIALAGGERLALVIIGAVVAQGLIALSLGRRFSSAVPLVAVLILLAANEIVTIANDRYVDDAELMESARDLILAMALPTLLFFASRFLPRLFRTPVDVHAPPPRDRYALPRPTDVEDVEFEEVT